jgi:hypothetical protein
MMHKLETATTQYGKTSWDKRTSLARDYVYQETCQLLNNNQAPRALPGSTRLLELEAEEHRLDATPTKPRY